MFLKIAHAFKHSITFRLSILFAALSTLLLVFLSVSLFWITTWQLKQEDVKSLTDFSALIKKDLLIENNLNTVIKKNLYQDLSVFHYHHYQMLVLNEQSGVLFRSERFPNMLLKGWKHIAHPVPVNKESLIKIRRIGHQQQFLVSVFSVSFQGSPQKTVTVVIVLNASHHVVFLEKLKKMLFWFVLGGFILFSVLGMVLTPRELKPLKVFSKRIKSFSMGSLAQRISKEPWPDEVKGLAVTFDELMSHLESGVRALNHFSSDLAHELKTPITNLRVETEVMLEQSRSNEEYEFTLRNNLEELERLSTMIERLLVLARLDNSAFQLCLSTVSLSSRIKKLVAYYDIVAMEKGILITLTGEATILADVTLIEMAIGNLISNAVKYSSPDTQIDIEVVSLPNKEVEVRVKDTGMGILATQQACIFDRFYRGDLSRSQNIPGDGLGLAIVKAIMDVHKGTASVESRQSEGSLFILTFPHH
jgi:two-component system, OmpR family, heavy metal sensor histidine kinase CusS